jgi:hypothetical protein
MSGELSTPPPAEPSTLPDDLRSDVLDIVSDAVQWRLPETRWSEVEHLMCALYQAMRGGRVHDIEQSVVALELTAPLRMTPIGGDARVGATRQVRDIADKVVHGLGEGLGSDCGQLPGTDGRDENGSADGRGR